MAADIETGTGGLHRFEEASGDALDSSGNNLTLTETSGTIATITGPNGVATARDFEAGDTEYFARASSGAMAVGVGSWMKTGWFFAESFPANAVLANEGWQGAGSTNRSHVIFCPSSGSIRATIGVSTGNVDNSHTQSFVTGRWYFGAFGYDSVNDLLFVEIDLGTASTISQATAQNASTGPVQFGASSDQALYWDGGLANWRTIVGRFPSKEDRHAMRLERYVAQTYYVDPNASGSNNGTSAANAWTSLATPAATVESTGIKPDDQLHLNASATTPYVGGQNISGRWGVDLFCDGADGWNAIGGRLFSTATGPSSNVFTATNIAEPSHMTWNWRDDPTGATTNWVNDAHDIELLDRFSVAARDRAPSLGFLERDTSTPTTPAEGKWGWTSTSGGSLFLNPPGSPDQATVRTSARYCPTGAHGIGLIGCSKSTFTGPAYFELFPGVPNSEYGLFVNGQDIVVEGVVVRAGPWHGIGCAGVSPPGGPRNTFRDCTVVGCTTDETSSGSMSPFVAYQPNTATEFGGHVFEDCVYIGAPRFLNSGAPATTNFLPQPMIVHSDSPVTTMTATVTRMLAIEKSDQLEAFHGGTYNGVGYSTLSEGTVSDPFAVTGYPMKFVNVVHKGRFVPSAFGKISYSGGKFDRHGCGRSNLAACNASTGVGQVYIKDAFLILGDHSGDFFDQFASTDALVLDNCKILIQASTSKTCLASYLSATTGTKRVRIINCQIDTADATKLHGVIRGNSTAYNANFDDIQSGGNVFGSSIVPAYNSDGSASRDFAWWQANVTGASTDTQRNLGWGTTAAEKVAYLRQWEMTGVEPRGAQRGPVFSPVMSPVNPPLPLLKALGLA